MYINSFKYLTSTLDTVDIKFKNSSQFFYILDCNEHKTLNFDQIKNKQSYAKYHKRRVCRQCEYVIIDQNNF